MAPRGAKWRQDIKILAPKNGASWRHFFWRHVAPFLNYERQKMAPRGAIFAPKWHQMVLLAKLAMLPVSPNKKWRRHFPLINANGWRHLAPRGTIFSSYLFDTFMEWYFGTDVARQTLLPKYLNTRINGSVIIFNLYPILTMRNTILMIRTLPQEQFLRFFIFSILSKFWQNIQQKTSGKWRHVAPFFSENGAIWRWPTLTVPRASSRVNPNFNFVNFWNVGGGHRQLHMAISKFIAIYFLFELAYGAIFTKMTPYGATVIFSTRWCWKWHHYHMVPFKWWLAIWRHRHSI